MLSFDFVNFLCNPIIDWHKGVGINTEFFFHDSGKITITIYFMNSFPYNVRVLLEFFKTFYIKPSAFISLNLNFSGSFISLIISILSIKSSFIWFKSLSLLLYKSLTSSKRLFTISIKYKQKCSYRVHQGQVLQWM